MCDSRIANGQSLNASIAAVSKIYPMFGNVAKASIKRWRKAQMAPAPGSSATGEKKKVGRPKLIAHEHRDAIKKEVCEVLCAATNAYLWLTVVAIACACSRFGML